MSNSLPDTKLSFFNMSTDPVLPARASGWSSSHNLLRIRRFSSISKMRTRNASNIVLSVMLLKSIRRRRIDLYTYMCMYICTYQLETLKGRTKYNTASVQSIIILLNIQAGITLPLPQCASTCGDILLNRPNELAHMRTCILHVHTCSYYSLYNILVCKFYQPPTWIPNLGKSYMERREHCSSLADVNADGLPHGFEVARKCRKVSFSTPCDVAASGTNPWAQRQAKASEVNQSSFCLSKLQVRCFKDQLHELTQQLRWSPWKNQSHLWSNCLTYLEPRTQA